MRTYHRLMGENKTLPCGALAALRFFWAKIFPYNREIIWCGTFGFQSHYDTYLFLFKPNNPTQLVLSLYNLCTVSIHTIYTSWTPLVQTHVYTIYSHCTYHVHSLYTPIQTMYSWIGSNHRAEKKRKHMSSCDWMFGYSSIFRLCTK